MTVQGTAATLVEEHDHNQQKEVETQLPSLIIPITSSSSSNKFIEIFRDELREIPSSTLLQVLKDEAAPQDVWSDVGLAYMQENLPAESSAILQAACSAVTTPTTRLLASAGLAQLAVSSSDPEAQRLADQRFTSASKQDTFFPMNWMGQGYLNYTANRLDQARFFFETTLRQCGPVLPALLGLAAVHFRIQEYAQAQALYGQAMQLHAKEQGGAFLRVGFGLASYQLGQVDRAKAAFQRALEIDSECVPAMVATAILNLQSESTQLREAAMKLLSMAHLLDHDNAMVQNHLANHYFWKWTPLPGTVTVQKGSAMLTTSQPLPLDVGEYIRVGMQLETFVEFDEVPNQEQTIVMKDVWTEESSDKLKLWKKDYDRVGALAKGAYSSTTQSAMQAESLFLLARVHHVRHEIDNAYKLYEKACKLAPEFAPARFGLAQTLVAQEDYTTAMKHLSILVQTSPMATDALALLGLLQVRSGQMNEGLLHIHKAMDLEPLNPDLITLEALALQREQPARALERYHKAVELLETTQQPVPYEIFCNIGVLCHETMQHPRALEYYTKALQVLPEASIKETKTFVKVLHPENCMFWNWIPAGQIQRPPAEGSNELVVESLLQDLEPGDHVRLGDTFISLVVQVNKKGASTTLVVKEAFLPPSAEAEPAEGSEEAPSQPMSVQFHVKRQNRLLENPKAITIAFNIARVHENAGNTVAAVQLHKAIVQRVPGYVNSYLRLACIARDNGCLKECSAWLKIACTAAPGNPEVLTLVGNLHLSLCDWAPAQNVFDQLLIKRVASVEAYSKLSMGNIYFANLDNPKTYAKNLKKAVDLYKSILGKDKANAYAANGIGAYLAERGEIFKAKEVFNRVREVSSDTIADAILNLGHIYLAQKKHPEALQMYNSYMKRTQDGTAPITTKNRQDDEAEVLLYIAFAYFDWARQAEALNNAQSAPADERYAMCTRHLELALQKSKRKEVLLFYNLCMTKLQAANCVLQKLTRNIRRTAQEVEDALKGLEKSLPKVEEILKWKNEGKKIPIHSSTLHDFITHCKANIDSAKSHLEEERKREQQAEQMRELQRSAAEAQKQEEELRKVMEQEEAAKLQEERDRKAAAKMKAVEQLRAGWEQEAENKKLEKERKAKGQKGTAVEDGGDLVPDDEEDQVDENAALFEETSDEEDEGQPTEKEGDYGTKADGVKEINPSGEPESVINENELFGDSDEDEVDHEKEVDHADSGLAVSATAVDAKELFGDSDDDESDEELVSTEKKRAADEDDNVAPAKRQRLIDEEGEEES